MREDGGMDQSGSSGGGKRSFSNYIFRKKSQQDLLVHQCMYVTEGENSTITPKFGSKRVGVAIIEMEKDVGGCLDKEDFEMLVKLLISYVSNRHRTK